MQDGSKAQLMFELVEQWQQSGKSQRQFTGGNKKHRRCGRLVAPGFSPGYTCDRQKPPMQSVDQRDGVPVGEKDQMLFNENL